MRFHRRPGPEQLVRLAALRVDVRAPHAAPGWDSSRFDRWKQLLRALFIRRRTVVIEPEPGWADSGRDAGELLTPAAGGARVYHFPQPAVRRLR